MGERERKDGIHDGNAPDGPEPIVFADVAEWPWPGCLTGLDSGSDVSLAPECVWSRREEIRSSHARLRMFAPWELQVLLTLKRPPGPKGWTLREDILILTAPVEEWELSKTFPERNIASVKKRLQLLKSKGLAERRTQEPAS